MKRISQAKKLGRICLKLIKESVRSSNTAELTTMAGSLAYTTVLSIVPLLAVMFYVFKIFGGLEYAYRQLMPFLLDILSEGTGEVVEQHLGTFVHQVQAQAVGGLGIVGLLFTSLMTYQAIVRSFNRIWEVRRPAPLRNRLLRAITLLTVGPTLMTASIAVTTAVAARIQGIPFSGQFVALFLNITLFALVYALIPTVKVPFRIIAIGSVLPGILLELAKYGYAIYTKRMVSYSAFYGSFAAIPLFLLWIYIAWCITLFGAVWVRTLQNYQKLKGHRNVSKSS